MKPGPRKFGAATCKVSRTVQVPVHMRDHMMEVSAVFTPIEERNQGFATKLMGLVCDEADAANKLLLIHVQPYGEPDLGASQLEKWYGDTFGFIRIQEKPLLMARAVGATPRFLNNLTPIGQAIQLQ
jgi:hypothetical protein